MVYEGKCAVILLLYPCCILPLSPTSCLAGDLSRHITDLQLFSLGRDSSLKPDLPHCGSVFTGKILSDLSEK